VEIPLPVWKRILEAISKTQNNGHSESRCNPERSEGYWDEESENSIRFADMLFNARHPEQRGFAALSIKTSKACSEWQ